MESAVLAERVRASSSGLVADAMAPALDLCEVTCSFASAVAGGERYVAVASTSLRVEAGEFVSVVGPTGCGKSTLLNMSAGLLQPTEGTVHVFGRPLVAFADGINSRAGYMFQAESLLPWRTALGNVLLGLQYRGTDPERAQSIAMDWLERVGLDGFEHHYPHQLSGGMRKRTALAQTLAPDPDIILMDEPFSALDVQTRQLMENEVLDLWAAGSSRRSPVDHVQRMAGQPATETTVDAHGGRKAVLFITHDLDEAIAMSDRVVVLSAGPATHPIGEFVIDLPRPRDVAEVRHHPRFIELHTQIWNVLRDEVQKGYAQQRRRAKS
jgi:NitT/TauT family transport system ATP-binding protein